MGGASVRSSVSPSIPTCTTGGRTSGSPCTLVPQPWATAREPECGGGLSTSWKDPQLMGHLLGTMGGNILVQWVGRWAN